MMKKKNRELNDYVIRKFVNSPYFNKILPEILYFIEQWVQGKLFFNQDKIKLFQEKAPMFFGKSKVFYRNEKIQIYVDQYNEFKSMVTEDFPNLFQIEEEYSRQNIFTKKLMAHPMENVSKSVLFYGELTGSELMNRIGQLGRDLLEIVSKAEMSSLSESDALNLLKKSFEFLKKQDESLIDDLVNVIKNDENYPDKEKFSDNINQIRNLRILRASSLESFKNKRTEIVKNFLIGIQDTQSHIEYFCRYFHRLVHIKKYGNTKYGEEYYNYNRKTFDEDNFRKMCKSELNDYPDLKTFLRRYCKTFKKLRNIRAHQITGEVDISLKGFITIPTIGNEKGVKFNYIEKREKMVTYGVFINKIRLHSHNPYDLLEDLFFVMDR